MRKKPMDAIIKELIDGDVMNYKKFYHFKKKIYFERAISSRLSRSHPPDPTRPMLQDDSHDSLDSP